MEENVKRVRALSSPELMPNSSTHQPEFSNDYGLEGMATNVKLLLKLIQDHNEAGNKENDDRKTQRIAGMLAILEDVKIRIEKSQESKKRAAELRRCNTDVRPNRVSMKDKDKKPQETASDEKEKLRRQLSASLAARKSLEAMCSSLGKEKEIMATELAKKVHELNEMEELVNDLKAQNETLLTKLKACAVETQKEKKLIGGEAQGQGHTALHDRNRALSEQLLRSLDSYRSLKRKYKDVKEESIRTRNTMDELVTEAAAGLERIRSFKQRLPIKDDQEMDIEEEILALEQMFKHLDTKINLKNPGRECPKQTKTEIDASKHSVIAQGN